MIIRIERLLIFENDFLFYYAIPIISLENGPKTTILSFIVITFGTIYRPIKLVTLTSLLSGIFYTDDLMCVCVCVQGTPVQLHGAAHGLDHSKMSPAPMGLSWMEKKVGE